MPGCTARARASSSAASRAHARDVRADALGERGIVERVVERAIHLVEPVDLELVEQAPVRR